MTDFIEEEIIEEFTHLGLECEVKCIREGHYAGYVRVPEELHGEIHLRYHPDEWDGWQEPDISVHGGITYGPDGEGWVGFDCAHASDVCFTAEGDPLPGYVTQSQIEMRVKFGPDEMARVWQPQDVIEETRRLADQIADYR